MADTAFCDIAAPVTSTLGGKVTVGLGGTELAIFLGQLLRLPFYNGRSAVMWSGIRQGAARDF